MYEQKVSSSMLERKRLHFNWELKSLAASGEFAGYASVFEVVDNQRDVVTRGAFAETLKGRVAEIKLLWQHQPEEPVGVFKEIFEDARGLYVHGKLLMDVARAKEAHALMKAGAISGLSIGYSPTRYKIDPETGIRRITAVKLWEISLVTFPANAAAQITVVKQENWESEIRSGKMIALSDALNRAINALS